MESSNEFQIATKDGRRVTRGSITLLLQMLARTLLLHIGFVFTISVVRHENVLVLKGLQ